MLPYLLADTYDCTTVRRYIYYETTAIRMYSIYLTGARKCSRLIIILLSIFLILMDEIMLMKPCSTVRIFMEIYYSIMVCLVCCAFEAEE